MRDGLRRPKPSKFDNIKSPRAGQPVDLDASLEQVQDPGPPSPIDHKQTVSALLAQAAQWPDVSGDSDIHEDDL